MTKLPNTFITIVTCAVPLSMLTREQMAREVAAWREDITRPLVLDEGAQLHLYNLMTGQSYSTEQLAGIQLGENNLPSYLVPGRDPTLTRLPAADLLGENHSDGNLLDPPLNL